MNYHLTELRVNRAPVTGRYLAHNGLTGVQRAFLGADLCTGARPLIDITIVQSAMLARTNRTYVHSAIQQGPNRSAIEAGLLPLVPKSIAKTNGVITDSELFDIIRSFGLDHVLEVASRVEDAMVRS
jgi:hypothetical protein